MHRRVWFALLVLLSAVLACTLPGSTNAPTETVATASSNSDPTQAISIPPTTTTASPEIEPTSTDVAEVEPRPSSFLEVLETNVASGLWTQEEGLLLGLKGLTGEATVQESFGDVIEGEGTGLILEAQRYIQEGADATVKAELAQLLSLLQVDPTRLEPFSQPEATSSASRPPGLAAPSRDASGDCANLWVAGFPSNTPLLCFLYKQQNLGGNESRIYYPAWWQTGDIEFAYAQAAHEALADAAAIYGFYGSLGGINLVFTVLPETGNANTLAMVPQAASGTAACLILVYPRLIQEDQANPSSQSYGVFKQVIAHELFHCFQAFNYPDKFLGSPWPIQAWWGEASAEYFSNLVYPFVNYEWRFASSFDSKALTTSIFGMAYENFEFFQYLGNRIGAPGVIELIAGLPAGEIYADQVNALAAYPDIANIYHEFGLAYLDHMIMDTSGAAIPGVLTGSVPSKGVGSNPQETVILTVQPFVLGVKQLIYLEKKIYSNAITSGAIAGERSARPVEIETGWLDDLPEEVIAGCGVEAFRILVTSTVPTSTAFETTVVVTVEEEIDCDQCLVGSWELNKDSFEARMVSLLDTPEFVVNFIEGGWRFTFAPNGDFSGKFTDFIVNYTIISFDTYGDPIITVAEMNIDGQSSGKYYVGAPGILVMSQADNSGVDFLYKIWINGDLIDELNLDEFTSPVNPAAAGEYTCLGDTLSIRNEPLDLPENIPVDYDRVGGP